MKTKTFDCVQAKYDAQLRVYDQICGMTVEQQLDYFRRAPQSDSPEARKFRGIPSPARTAADGTPPLDQKR